MRINLEITHEDCFQDHSWRLIWKPFPKIDFQIDLQCNLQKKSLDFIRPFSLWELNYREFPVSLIGFGFAVWLEFPVSLKEFRFAVCLEFYQCHVVNVRLNYFFLLTFWALYFIPILNLVLQTKVGHYIVSWNSF